MELGKWEIGIWENTVLRFRAQAGTPARTSAVLTEREQAKPQCVLLGAGLALQKVVPPRGWLSPEVLQERWVQECGYGLSGTVSGHTRPQTPKTPLEIPKKH